MFVRDVMTPKVISVRKDTPYRDIVSLLIRKRISGVTVINEKGNVVGIISEKDLLYALFPSQEEFYKDLHSYMDLKILEKEVVKVVKLKAKDIMSKEVISVHSDDHVLKACSLLVINKIRRLPVIDNGRLVGIVTSNTIYRDFLRKVTRRKSKNI